MLMRGAADPEATRQTLKELEELTSHCEVCQRLSEASGRLRVSLPPEEIIFKRTVCMDIMTRPSQEKNLIHFIHRDTLFSAA